MSEKSWEDAIKIVLRHSGESMHYKAIAEEIANQELRENFGATPASTVNVVIGNSLKSLRDRSPFVRTGRGYYYLRGAADRSDITAADDDGGEVSVGGVVQSLGMYWRSSEIVWRNRPKVLGQQQAGSDRVDFCDQIGVYLLHDRNRVVYVGRSIDRPMGQRLFEHTKDRLNGRWDRFSWFGLKAVGDDGMLSEGDMQNLSIESIISALEAVLIEAIEPAQNRRRGDQLSAVEYLQVSDPEKDKQKVAAISALISGMVVDGG